MMNRALDDLVVEISSLVRYRELTDSELQQICCQVFMKQYPPEPFLYNDVPDLVPRGQGFRKYTTRRLPPGWQHFIEWVPINYDGTTRLALAIARKLVSLVRHQLREESLVLQHGCAV